MSKRHIDDRNGITEPESRLILISKGIEKARLVHGDKYDYSKVKYTRQQDKVMIGCPEHGIFVQAFHSHLQGAGCPACGNLKISQVKRTDPMELKDSFVSQARKIHGDIYGYGRVSFEGKTTKDKVTITCPRHGRFDQTWGNHITLRHGCPKCGTSRDHIKKRMEKLHGTVEERRLQFLKESKTSHAGFYSYPNLIEEFKGYYSKITVVCPNCGPFLQYAHNHARGHGCYRCKRSTVEREVENWVREHMDGELIVGNRKVIAPKEIDLYLPSYSMAIEVGGVYYHSTRHLERNYHFNKWRECAVKGIKLVTLFDSEWFDSHKREIIKSRLLLDLGRVTRKLQARKGDLVEMSPRDARSFLEENHLQGYAPASRHLGLSMDGEIVSVMTLAKSRFDKTFEWELIRFCSLRNHSVAGAFSRLFRRFIWKENPKSVVTYADLRWGDGASYRNAGFEFLRLSAPAPWYAHAAGTGPLISRMHLQKHKLPSLLKDFDPVLTADENLSRAGYVKLYDCGNAVYAWKE